MLMKQTEQRGYISPEIEITDIKIERGFYGSLEDPEPDGEL